MREHSNPDCLSFTNLIVCSAGALCSSNLHGEAAVVSERIGKRIGSKGKEEEDGKGEDGCVQDEELPVWIGLKSRMPTGPFHSVYRLHR